MLALMPCPRAAALGWPSAMPSAGEREGGGQQQQQRLRWREQPTEEMKGRPLTLTGRTNPQHVASLPSADKSGACVRASHLIYRTAMSSQLLPTSERVPADDVKPAPNATDRPSIKTQRVVGAGERGVPSRK
jgi:hypothetical protein